MSASGKEEDKTKVLVVYGTRWGGTAGVASRISEVLRGNGFNVDVENARRKLSKISDYDAVIVGSGIRANQWTKNVLTFLEKNARDLRKKKTAFFVSCSMAERTETEIREKAKEAYLTRVAERFRLSPISYGFFGGCMNMKQSHGLLADLIVKINGRNLRRHGLDTSGVTDNRDWAAIQAWTEEVAKLLSNSSQ